MIYTREECKILMNELQIVSKNQRYSVHVKKITIELMESILFHTSKCRDNISERIYWILNNIKDYPNCKHCGKYFKPRFYGIGGNYRGGNFCSPKCFNNNSEVTDKKKITCRERYGYDNPSQSPEVRIKMQITCEEKYGYKIAAQSEQVKEKTRQIFKNKPKKEKPIKIKRERTIEEKERSKEKAKQTSRERYGCDNPAQNEQVKEKTRQTCLKKYNVAYSAQSTSTIEKREQTCLERFGSKNPFGSREIIDKIQITNEERYNAKYASQLDVTKEKTRQTNNDRHGVDWIMQKDEFYNASHQYKNKLYTLPSGNIISYQGYENVAFDNLLTEYIEEQIKTVSLDMPKIWYYNNDKKKRYYLDIFIPSKNLIIEVKSQYTFDINQEVNMLKKDACLDAGYNFQFWICSNKEVLEILNYDAGACVL